MVVIGDRDSTAGQQASATVYENDSTGTFTPIGADLAGVFRGAVDWGDFDRDGDLDLVVTGAEENTFDDGTTTIYRNVGDTDGDGQVDFEVVGAGLTGVAESSSDWGDVDGDGDLDLVITGEDPQQNRTATIYENRGEGTFQPLGAGLTGVAEGASEWGDFDGDGDLDLVVVGMDQNEAPTATLYRNEGEGQFSPVGAGLTDVERGTSDWGDFNGDGALDLLIAGRTSDGADVTIYRNQGDGSFFTTVPPEVAENAAWGDLDGDGDLDLVETDSETGTLIFEHRGTAQLSLVDSFEDGLSRGTLQWADADGDGTLDVLGTGSDANNALKAILYENQGSGAPNEPPTAMADTFSTPANRALAVSAPGVLGNDTDPDGDSLTAAVFAEPSHGTVTLDASGAFEYVPSAGFSGTDSFTYEASDGAVADTATATVEVVNEPPMARTDSFRATAGTPLTVPPPGVLGNDTDSDGHSLTAARVSGPSDGVLSLSADGSFEYTPAPEFAGTDSFRYEASDPTGAADTSTVVLTDELGELSITSVQPAAGAPGTPVRIYGAGFNPEPSENAVTFGSVAAPVDSVRSGVLYVRVPSSQAGPVPVSVAAGGATVSAPDRFAVITNGTGVLSSTDAGLAGVTDGAASWGDYDADGDPDLVVTGEDSTGGATATLYENEGDGSFSPVGAGLTGVKDGSSAAWGDVDGDSDLDLVVAGTDASGASVTTVYENEGNGTFSPIGAGLTGVSRSAVDWGDYNGDGHLDLVVAGETEDGSAETTIYENDGAGTFTAMGTDVADVRDGAVQWGDADGDGALDLLVTGADDSGSPVTTVYRNDGNGAFSAVGAGLTDVKRSAVDWGDADGDDRPDLVVTGERADGNAVATIYRNEGGGSFPAIGAGLAGVRDGAAAWGDVNGNGTLDLVLAGDDSATLYENEGGGTFIVVGTGLADVRESTAGWADLDRDGDLDLLLTGRSAEDDAPSSILYENEGESPMTLVSTAPAAHAPSADRSADLTLTFSRDVDPASVGVDSIAVTGEQSGAFGEADGSVAVSGNQVVYEPARDFRPGERIHVSVRGGIASTDGSSLDQGQTVEFVAASAPTPATFQQQAVVEDSAAGAQVVRMADVSGNGALDVVWGSERTSDLEGDIAWHANGGAGNFGDGQTIDTGVFQLEDLRPADVDADGTIDLVAVSGNGVDWYENAAGDGSTWTKHEVTTGVQESMHPTDVDGDGDLDVIVGSDQLFWMENVDGDGGTWTSHSIASDVATATALHAGDADDDGALDVFAVHDVSDGDDKVAWYRNDGTGTFGGQKIISTEVEFPTDVHAADVDRDGTLDVLSASNNDSKIAWYPNAGGGSFGAQQIVNVDPNPQQNLAAPKPQALLPSDVDGDGDLDVLAAAQFDNRVAWHENEGAGTFANTYVIASDTAGADTEAVTAGDADGDGDLDVFSAFSGGGTVEWHENSGTPEALAAAPDSFSTLAGKALEVSAPGVLENDSDAEGDPLSATLVNDVTNGSLLLDEEGAFTYVPADGFTGDDSFRYAATDPGGAADTTTVTITVEPFEVTVNATQPTSAAPGTPVRIRGGGFSVTPSDNTVTFGSATAPVDSVSRTVLYARVPFGLNGPVSLSVTARDTTVEAPGSFDVMTNGTGTFSPDGAGLAGVADSDAAWGDMDDDGDQDVVVVGDTSSGTTAKPTTTIYENDGNGGFTALNANLTGVLGGSADWGDFDQDGDLDLLVTGAEDLEVENGIATVYRNVGDTDGDGSVDFTAMSTGLGGVTQSAADWGDFDGDGDPDLVVAGRNANNVSVTRIYRNNDGTFAAIGAGLDAVVNGTVRWGDFDGDGDLDLLTAGGGSPGGAATTLYRNEGGGTFTPVGAGLTGVADASADWDDFDRDGDLDLVIAGQSSDGDVVTVYTNQGGGAFSANEFTIPADGSVDWGDLDGDGDPDLVVTDGSRPKVYENEGDGTFTDVGAGLTGTTRGSADWGDFDGDGDLDLLVTGDAGTNHPTTTIYENEGSGVANEPPTALPESFSTPANRTVRQTAPGLLGNDNDPDDDSLSATVASEPSNGSLTLRPDGSFAYWADPGFTGEDSFAYEAVDKNGRTDAATVTITVSSPAVSVQSLQPSSGAPGTTMRIRGSGFEPTPAGNTVAVGGEAAPVDSASRTVLHAQVPSNVRGPVEVSVTTRDTTVTGPQRFAAATGGGVFNALDAGLTGVRSGGSHIADLNNDGHFDLVVTGDAGTFDDPTATVYLGDGQGGFTEAGAGLTGVLDGSVSVGDVNNDGALDLFIAGEGANENQTATLYLGDGQGGFTEAEAGLTGVEDGSSAFGDVNGDGLLDLIVTGEDANRDPSATLYVGTGQGDFREANAGLTGVVGRSSSSFGDVNNDGHLDLVITGIDDIPDGTETATLYLGDGRTNFTAANATLTGVGGSASAFGDVDADGNLDLVITGRDAGGTRRATLYEGDGQGGFTPAGADLTGVRSGSVSFGEANGDGHLDLLITGGDPDINQSATLYLGDGQGDFARANAGLEGVQSGSSSFGDVNTDGTLDLLITGQNQNSDPSTILYESNSPPTAVADSFSTPKGEPLTVDAPGVLGNDSDHDNDSLSAAVVNGPSNGSLTLDSDGAFEYAPDAGFFGEDQFRYEARDGRAGADTATVTLSVELAAPPITTVQPQSGAPGTPVRLYGPGFATTPDSNTVTFGAVDAPVDSVRSNVLYTRVPADVSGPVDVSVSTTGGAASTATQRFLVATGGGVFVEADAALADVDDGSSNFADVNNDGHLDLLLTGDAGIGEPSAIMYLGDGQGGFTETSTSLTGVRDASASVGDVNGDGNVDVLINGLDANNERTTTLYLGDGQGGFTAANAGLADVRDGSASFGDVNGDGNLDLLVTGKNENLNPSSTLYLGDGQGGFAEAGAGLTDVQKSSTAIGDVDNDGHLDLLITGRDASDSPTAALYLGDGQGNFTEVSAGLTGVEQSASSFGDVDADGNLDIAIIGENASGTSTTTLYLGNGQGGFQDANAGLTGVDRGASAFADANGDGNVDLLITGTTDANGDPTTTLYLGDGEGGFAEAEAGLNPADRSSSSFGDVDEDGTLDLVVAGGLTTLYDNRSGNTPPTATADSFATSEDQPLTVAAPGVLGNDTDPEGDSLSTSLVDSTSNGSLTLDADGAFEYAPDQNFNGTDSFRYAATDDSSAADTAAVAIAVAPRNDPPVAEADTFLTVEDSTLTVSAPGVLENDSDPDEDSLSAAVVNGPSNGSLTLDADGSFSYTPNAGFADVDQFTYAATDDSSATDTTTVTIPIETSGLSITAVQPRSGAPGTPVRVYGAGFGTAAGDNAVTFGDETAPVDSVRTNVLYTRVPDGVEGIADLTVSRSGLNATATRPFAVVSGGGTFSPFGAGLTGVDGGSAHLPDVNNDGNLDVLLTGDQDVFEPSTTLYLGDGTGDFTEAGVGLTDVRESAAAVGDVNEDGNVDLLITGIDANNDRTTTLYLGNGLGGFTAANAGLENIVRGSASTADVNNDSNLDLLLTGKDASGNPSATLYLGDGQGGFTEAGAGLTGVTESTAAVGDVDGDGTLDLVLAGRDASDTPTTTLYLGDGQGGFNEAGAGLTGVEAGAASLGDVDDDGNLDLVLTGRTASDTPTTTLYLGDGQGGFSEAGAGLTGLWRSATSMGDVDGNGTLDLVASGLAESGGVSVLYLGDGQGGFSEATAGLDDVNQSAVAFGDVDDSGTLDLLLAGSGPTATLYQNQAPNVPPTARADSFSTPEDVPLTVGTPGVLGNDTDANGDSLSAALVSDVLNGSLTFNSDGSFEYVPDSYFNGTDSFSYAALDDSSAADTAAVTITVEPRNAPPVAQADTFQTPEGTTLTVEAPGVLEDDTDPEGDSLTAALINGPPNGSLSLDADGSFSYFPDPGFTGEDQFAYAATDDSSAADTTSVTLLVGVSGISITSVRPRSGAPGTPVRIHGSGFASEADDNTVTFGSVSAPVDSARSNVLYTQVPAGLSGPVDVSVSRGSVPAVAPRRFVVATGGGVFSALPAGVTDVRLGSSNFADVDGDGILDLLITGFDGANPSTTLYLGEGEGDFTEAGAGLTAVQSSASSIADLDEDGNLDLLITGRDPNGNMTTTLYMGDGQGGFSEANAGLTGVQNSSTSIGDVNNDGNLDLLITGRDTNLDWIATLYLGDGQGGFTTAEAGLTISNVSSTALGDVDNDGNLDVLIAGGFSTTLYLGDGQGGFTAANANLEQVVQSAVSMGDVDADGNLDLLITGRNIDGASTATLYQGDGQGDFTEAGAGLTGVREGATSIGEIDGDGNLDLLIAGAEGTSDRSTTLYLGNGVGGFSAAGAGLGGRSEASASLGDVGSDGDLDLVVTGNASGGAATDLYQNASPNAPPVAAADTFATAEDSTLTVDAPGVLENDSDPNGDSLSVALVDSTSNGSLTLDADGAVEYVPNPDFNGEDDFAYAALDDSSAADTAAVTIDVVPRNDPPVARADTFSTTEDSTLSVSSPGVLGNDTDPEGDSLSTERVSGPSNGSLTLADDSGFTYTPQPGFQGSDQFTYEAADDSSAADTASVTIEVAPVNDPPVATADSFATPEDSVLTVEAPGVLENDSDADGDSLTAALVDSTSNGSLVLDSDGAFEYGPDANFNGEDGFAYAAVDDSSAADTASVTITVDPVNDPPVARADSFEAVEDSVLTVPATDGLLANDQDPEGDSLSITGHTGVTDGTLSVDADGAFEYSPDADFNGTDGFRYEAVDPSGAADSASVTIAVEPVNDPPVARADSFQVVEDSVLTVEAPGVLENDSDGDGDSLSAALVSGVSNGSLTLGADGSFEYAPAPNFDSTDTFRYAASDPNGAADTTSVTIKVQVDPAPEITDPIADQSLRVGEAFAQDLTATFEDPDGDALTFSASSSAEDIASVSLSGSVLTVTGEAAGSATVAYAADDGTDSTGTTFAVEVNAPPVAEADSFETREDSTLVVAAPGVLGNDTDPGGDSLAASVVEDVEHGTLTLGDDGAVEYSPAADFSGADGFTYTATDPGGLADTASVTIAVAPVNDAPVAEADSFSTPEGQPLTVSAPGVLANDTDVDDDSLSASLVSGVSNGSLTLDADGSFEYVPGTGFSGTDGFTYAAFDDSSAADTASVTLSVEGAELSIAAVQPRSGASGTPVRIYGTGFAATPDNNTVSFGAQPATVDSATANVLYTEVPSGASGPVDVSVTRGGNSATALRPFAVLTGGGAFSAFQANLTGVDQSASSIADINNDGHFDLIIAGDEGGFDPSTTVYLGDGTGGFTPAGAGLTNLWDASTAVGDVNEDGNVDILIIGEDADTENKTILYLGDGQGGFTAANAGLTNVSRSSASIADVDADGHLDLLVTGKDPNGDLRSTLYLGDGQGGFTDANAGLTGVAPGSSAIGDVNNDGHLDLVITGADAIFDATRTATVYLGDGQGSFTEADAGLTGVERGTSSFGDVDGDGNLDLVITGRDANDSPTATLYLGDGQGGFTEAGVGLTGVVKGATSFGDVNGNGTLDLLITGDDANNDRTATLYLGDGQGDFTEADAGLASVRNSSASMGDVDGDGTLDLLVTGDADVNAGPSATVYRNRTPNMPPTATADSFSTLEDQPLTVSAPGVLANDTDPNGDSLSATLVDSTSDGSLALDADGAVEYTPDQNFNGTDSFRYAAVDDSSAADTASVTITVEPVNDAPVATVDSFATPEDSVLTVEAPGVLENDSDVDGDTLSATLVDSTSDGSLMLGSDGAFEYSPDANFNGEDSFRYAAVDDSSAADTASVTITVDPVNDAPVAEADSFETAEDSALVVEAPGVLENDSDPDGDGLVASQVSGPSDGSLTLEEDGAFTYAPAPDFHGTDSFVYEVSDAGQEVQAVDSTTVTITVAPVNDAPVAAADSFQAAEDSTLTVEAPGVLENDTDVDGDSLTASLVSGVSNGSLTLGSDGSVAYTPDAGFTETDSLTYAAADPGGLADTALVTIEVQVDPAPVIAEPIADQSLQVGETLQRDLSTVFEDPDGDALTFSVSSSAEAVAPVSLDGSALTVTGEAAGSATVTYAASDGTDSTGTTFAVTVNAPPVAEADSFETAEDSTLTVPAPGVLGNDTDPGGDSLAASVVEGTDHGTLTLGEDGAVTYSPNPDFSGTDGFTYAATDPGGLADTASVTVTVDPVNDPPVATADSFSTPEDQTLTVSAPGVLSNDTDVDSDSLSAGLVSGVSSGTLTLGADGSFEYAPNANFNGTDQFTYEAIDGSGAADTAAVTITVTPVEDEPVARADSFQTPEDSTLTVAAPGVLENDSDPDGDGLVASVVVEPSSGELTLNEDGSLTYAPDADFNGTDQFVYTADDAGQDVAAVDSASVTLTVTPVNDPPIAEADSFATPEDSVLTVEAPGVLENDTDVDGDTLSATLVDSTSDGSLMLGSDGAFEYSPDADFNGEDSFAYAAVDDSSAADTASVTIAVEPVNDPPVARADSFEAVEDSALTVPATDGLLANDQDPEGDSLSITGRTGVTDGTLSVDADGAFEYTPDADFNGTDGFRYEAVDPSGAADSASVTIAVEPVNDPPVARADSFQVVEDSVLTVEAPGVLENDSDGDGDALSASLVDSTSSGSLTLGADGSFEYAPAPSFTGSDSFVYEAADGNGGTDVATVHLQVIQAEMTRTIELAAGWNLASVPLQATDQSFGAVLGPCESGFFFETGSGYESIADEATVPVGRGLFANCAEGTSEITGTVPAPQSIEVAAGWNLVGPFADSVDVSSITSTPPGIVETSFFGFDQTAGYEGTSTLTPGHGYWVKVTESGTLDLSGGGNGPALASKALASTQAASTSQEQPGLQLRLTDAAGRTATLRLTENLTETQRQRGALPPVPPSGVFDVRFEHGRSMAEMEEEGPLHTIETQGLAAPVTVDLAHASKDQGVRIRQAGETMRLTDEGSSVELASTEALAVGVQSVPDAFALKKTYPNPASGRATVAYAVPEPADVTIAVYDVLGRRVAILTDGPTEAGRHTARLGAGQLPSGTYFVRMRAEGFQQTRRLTVVR